MAITSARRELFSGRASLAKTQSPIEAVTIVAMVRSSETEMFGSLTANVYAVNVAAPATSPAGHSRGQQHGRWCLPTI